MNRKSHFSGHTSTNYPFISPDGMQLFFDSHGKTGTTADRDIWVVNRDGDGWTAPKPLDSNVNTPSTETFASVAANGNLYFCTWKENSIGGMDIYYSRKTNDGYALPANLGKAINSERNDFHPFIDPDEHYIIFDSQRPGGFGGNDLYISYWQPDGKWHQAVNMGPTVNSSYGEMRPYVSPDGKYLFFCSNRNILKIKNTDHPLSYFEFMQRIDGSGTGSQDIYWMDAQVIGRGRLNNSKN